MAYRALKAIICAILVGCGCQVLGPRDRTAHGGSAAILQPTPRSPRAPPLRSRQAYDDNLNTEMLNVLKKIEGKLVGGARWIHLAVRATLRPLLRMLTA